MKLVFATHNRNKIVEVQQLLPPDIELISLTDIGCTDIDETGRTLEENALIKARYIKENFGFDVFSDDSGLEVEALGWVPGVYSARYAGEEKNSQKNMELLLNNLRGMQNRKARFRTVIALVFQGREYLFQGEIQGEITHCPMGESGFGYDPIFLPEGQKYTFAQMSQEQKNAISHRGRAVAKLAQFFKEYRFSR